MMFFLISFLYNVPVHLSSSIHLMSLRWLWLCLFKAHNLYITFTLSFRQKRNFSSDFLCTNWYLVHVACKLRFLLSLSSEIVDILFVLGKFLLSLSWVNMFLIFVKFSLYFLILNQLRFCQSFFCSMWIWQILHDRLRIIPNHYSSLTTQ